MAAPHEGKDVFTRPIMLSRIIRGRSGQLRASERLSVLIAEVTDGPGIPKERREPN